MWSKKMPFSLSDRVLSMNESVTLKMAKIAAALKAEGKDIISLSLGEPDFNVPDSIKEAGKKAIDDNFSHYPPVAGIPALKKSIIEKFKRDNHIEYQMDQVMVSTGAKQSLMNLLLSLLNEGDEILIPAPYWVSYIEMARLCGAKIREPKTTIETNFKLTPTQLENELSDKTKVFLFSNPCNPSGSFYSEKELRELGKVFAQFPNLVIISDEIYEYINFVDEGHFSLAQIDELKNQVVIVNGVSKAFAMTGYRIGYMAGPSDLIKAAEKIQGQFTSGANAVAQVMSSYALDHGKKYADKMCQTFLERRDYFRQELEKLPGIRVNNPDGAFYLFINIDELVEAGKIKDSAHFCEYLLEQALIASTPGAAFGLENHVRLSYANSMEQLQEASKRLKKALEKL